MDVPEGPASGDWDEYSMDELREDEEAHRSEDEREFGTREQDGDSGEDDEVDGTPLLGLRALQSPSPTLDEHGQETPSEVSPAERRTPARRGGWAYVARPKWTAIRKKHWTRATYWRLSCQKAQ